MKTQGTKDRRHILIMFCSALFVSENYFAFLSYCLPFLQIISGPGLVFEVYPEAIGTLPGSQIWSFLFFLTVIMLGMDSAVSKIVP